MIDSRARYTGFIGLFGGLALFIGLIAYEGVGEVSAALAFAGPVLLCVPMLHLLPMALDAWGWRRLVCSSPEMKRRFRIFLWARWLGESVNALLPVMQIGGHVARGVALAQRGVPGEIAAASVAVDLTVMVFTQMLFTLIGIALMIVYLDGARFAGTILLGLAMMGALLGAFYLAQRRGLFGGLLGTMRKWARGRGRGLIHGNAAAIDNRVTAYYGNIRALVTCGAWHLCGWIAGAGEVWFALYLLGHPVGIVEALVLESLGQAVRAAAFVVPGALGIQEGGFMIFGALIGLDSHTALALSLTKRLRELLLGVPGLLAWQVQGTTRLFRGVRERAEAG